MFAKCKEVKKYVCLHVLYLLYTQTKISFNSVWELEEELCCMRYVIWTAISHGHIK